MKTELHPRSIESLVMGCFAKFLAVARTCAVCPESWKNPHPAAGKPKRAASHGLTALLAAFLAATPGLMWGQGGALYWVAGGISFDYIRDAPELTPAIQGPLLGFWWGEGPPPAVKYSIYWADGPALSNKLSLIYSETVPWDSEGRAQFDLEYLARPLNIGSLVPPPGATWMLAVVDENNLIQQEHEENNLVSMPLATDIYSDLMRTNDGGVWFYYYSLQACGEWAPIKSTAAKLYWAKGPTLQDRTSETPIYSHSIQNPMRQEDGIQVDAALFRDPPQGSTGVLLVLDPDEVLLDPDRTNNLKFLSNVVGEITLIADTDPNVVPSPNRSPKTPTLIKGKVWLVRSGVREELKVGDLLLAEDIIETEEGSFVKLALKDGSILSYGPKSFLKITESMLTGAGNRTTFLDGIKGKIRFKVAPQGNDGKLEVRSKIASMGVRGTEFDLEYQELNGVGTTILTVYEGIVEAQDYATYKRVLVGAGETFQCSAAVLPPPSIVGSWFLPDRTGGGSVLTFLANGEYLFFKDGDSVANPGGQDGMERGTYSWAAEAGILSATVLADTNGEWGLSGGLAIQPSLAAAVYETTLSLTIPFKGKSSYTRVGSPTSPLVGSWYIVGGAPAGGVATVTFLADGSYYFAQDGDSGKDPTGMDGGERGSFTWDSGTGAFSATTAVDTCGEWGLSQLGPNPSVVLQNNSNTLILNYGNLPKPLCFYRVRPFDGTFEGWKATNALFGVDAEPMATPFADGISNLIRYALNLDSSPPPPGNLPLGQVVDISGTAYLAMEFRARKNLDGAILTPQFSTTLDNWQPVPAENIHRLADDDIDTERHVARMPLSGASLFLRLAATVPNP